MISNGQRDELVRILDRLEEMLPGRQSNKVYNTIRRAKILSRSLKARPVVNPKDGPQR